MIDILTSIGIFIFAALLEISGGYLIWRWLKNHQGKIIGLIGGLILFSYSVVMTLQPENFGKVYAAYGGIFVIFSLLWGYWIDKKKPDRFEIFGSIVVLIGISIMFYFPR
ncbi:MAG: YnfA family protein [Nitrosopumilus sp.]